MIVIAENINATSRSLGQAMRNRDAGPIRKMAETLAAGGADGLDLNVGPAGKAGPELMRWLVRTVREVVRLPLVLDSPEEDVLEAGLEAHGPSDPRPVINSIPAVPDRMARFLPLARRHDAGFVAMPCGPDGVPRDEMERGVLAAELLDAARREGIAPENVWLDPVVLPVSSRQAQLVSCTSFMAMLPDIAPDAMSICGLSNVSSGSPGSLRPLLNRVYLCMLRSNGLRGVILDGLDGELLAIARDERHPMQKLVDRLMTGEAVDPSSLTADEAGWLKTWKVLSNETVYADSWLDL